MPEEKNLFLHKFVGKKGMYLVENVTWWKAGWLVFSFHNRLFRIVPGNTILVDLPLIVWGIITQCNCS